ncbi:FAD:protein FMN transferase [Celeribacter litoreus]|uniref:FAD:protein FMN transferase n=1 Tax=Celeribacter litoreus TaxID=2876714 RepID=UPI001CCFE67D|nr:FAD:protein FMN transferase [Celeribacter litoreus]MCA0044433.1 FAD:protein FMN transferase [Celeribacter litoreus]
MRLSRRRFMTLSAAAVMLPQGAQAARWQGRMFGAEVSLELVGAREAVSADLKDVQDRLAEIEQRFSLFNPVSELSRLNNEGVVDASSDMIDVSRIASAVYLATGGAFDPTVQSIWEALAMGEEPSARAVGFDRVFVEATRVRLGEGQKLTLNGIAQGFATDCVRALLVERGYRNALINIGEYAALGGPFRVGLSDASVGRLGAINLENKSVATSSPDAMKVGERSHILSPNGGRPLWSTVSVEAESAALADACSTAFCLMPRSEIEQAKHALGLSRVFLVDLEGDLSTLS